MSRPIPKPYDLRHSTFEVTDGGLHYFAAERLTVTLGSVSLGGLRQLCQITISKKSGDIYVQFPYFRNGPGIIARIRCEVRSDLSTQIRFAETGKVASSLVKYSHPRDGNAHFSQDGKVRTEFWAKSLPLDGPDGHLFELHAYGLEAFAPLVAGMERRNRLYLPFWMEQEHPGGASVAVEWRTKRSLQALARERGRHVRPVDDLPRRSDGKLFKAAIVGGTRSSPLQDHVLVVNVGPLKNLPALSQPAMILIGGWAYPPEDVRPGSQLQFLAFSYPVMNASELASQVGSVDLLP